MDGTALLLEDLQNELVDPAGVVGSHGLAARAAQHRLLHSVRRLLVAARHADGPVIHVAVWPRFARVVTTGQALETDLA